MRNLKIIAAVAALSALLGSSAFADDRTTGSATLVAPNTQAYVGTFVQNCTLPSTRGAYVGVYLGQPFQIQGRASLAIYARNGLAFNTSPRANGEESLLMEVGGQSQLGCLPIGTTVMLVSKPLGPEQGPIVVLGSGIVH